MFPLLLMAAAGFAVTWVMTAVVRRHALSRSMIDIPNHRSSHTRPTPRGGGLAIAATVLAGVAVAGGSRLLSTDLTLALLGGGVLVGGIGWLDDRGHVPASLRILVHFAAAIWAVAWLGGLPALRLGVVQLPLGVLGSMLAVLGVVWSTNLYNFMDGIDGIAAGEAVTTGVFGAGLLLFFGETGLALIAALIAAASGGFLLWNWAPAKIFMGDVGSGLLGFLFASLAVASERADAVPIVVWCLLLGVFVFDASLTLLRRVTRGERWYAAHRGHAYQRLVQAGWPHARVGRSVVGLNLVLGGLAILSIRYPGATLYFLLVALSALGVLYGAIERWKPMRRTRNPTGAAG